MLDIITINELNKCVNILYDLSKTLKEIVDTKKDKKKNKDKHNILKRIIIKNILIHHLVI